MKYILVTMLLLSGCGSESQTNSDAPATQTAAPQDNNTLVPQPQIVETPMTTDTDAATDTAPIPYSMALDSAADLPACDDAHQHQLVYLLTEQQFQTCQTGAWTVVDIQGPKGDIGAVGPKGDKGDIGPAGADAPSLASNEWIDPVTSNTWLMGGAADRTVIYNLCPTGWNLPTNTELRSAINDGLYVGFISQVAADNTYQCANTQDGRVAIRPGSSCPEAEIWGFYCWK